MLEDDHGTTNEVAVGELGENGQVGLFAGGSLGIAPAGASMCGSTGSGEDDQGYESQ
jgi:hypothetical protein